MDFVFFKVFQLDLSLISSSFITQSIIFFFSFPFLFLFFLSFFFSFFFLFFLFSFFFDFFSIFFLSFLSSFFIFNILNIFTKFSIIVKALSSTFVVFSCFTASALLSKDRTYLYLGGFLSSAISTLLWLSFFNIFMRSESVLNFQLYFGLLVLCGFILYDTQLIVEKAKLGSRDYLVHALTLFTDFFGVFIRLLAIFSKNERSNDRDRRRR